jgi:hypothetical protein
VTGRTEEAILREYLGEQVLQLSRLTAEVERLRALVEQLETQQTLLRCRPQAAGDEPV